MDTEKWLKNGVKKMINPNKIFEPLKSEEAKYARKIFRDIGLTLILWIFGIVIIGLITGWIIAFGR